MGEAEGGHLKTGRNARKPAGPGRLKSAAAVAFVAACATAVAIPVALAEPTAPPTDAGPPAPSEPEKDVDVPASHAPLGVRVEDRNRFAEATRLLKWGAVGAAYEVAQPLFEAYPDNVRVQDLRCRIATERHLDRDSLLAECEAYARLTRVRDAELKDGGARRPQAAVPPPPPAPAPASAAPVAPQGEPSSTQPSEPRLLVAYAGVGFTNLNNSPYGGGAGLYVESDYVIRATRWIMPKAYAGAFLTFPEGGSCAGGGTPCDVSAKMAFVGGKFRLTAPIPYVSPFLEVGLGLSLGVLTSRTPAGESTSYFTYNIPVSFGLVLGKDQTVELGIASLAQPSAAQYEWAVAIGLAFPLR